MSLHTLIPHSLAVEPPDDEADTLQAALDAVDHGVMVCDARGRVLRANRAAQLELDTGGVLAVGADGLLDVPGGAGLLALRRAVHGAAFSRSHQLVPLRVNDRTLMLSVQPLGGGDGPVRVLLMTGRRSLCPELAVRHLGRVYALTPAELEVLGSLLAGVRIGEMADARGVKLSTVRTQVASLRAKLGVQRVDDITRLVAELPPMQGALGRQVNGHGVHRQAGPASPQQLVAGPLRSA
jgi:DNA-binding CsgD family transcriptional regulator